MKIAETKKSSSYPFLAAKEQSYPILASKSLFGPVLAVAARPVDRYQCLIYRSNAAEEEWKHTERGFVLLFCPGGLNAVQLVQSKNPEREKERGIPSRGPSRWSLVGVCICKNESLPKVEGGTQKSPHDPQRRVLCVAVFCCYYLHRSSMCNLINAHCIGE